jgi:hypothetical protein
MNNPKDLLERRVLRCVQLILYKTSFWNRLPSALIQQSPLFTVWLLYHITIHVT